MIIRKVQLEPFGKFPLLECEFKPGLNVVLGSNEAGKTTLVNAIHAALFIPPNVRRNSQDWKDVLSRYLPHPHGDTARVVLEMADADGSNSFKLNCAWGAEKETRLILDDGVEISDEISVSSRLGELLRHSRGTYESVLISRQADLIRTLERIRQDKEALTDLADMLRAVIFQSGGISVDELKNKLLKNIEGLEDNWDTKRNGPRDGRDIDNRHQRNVGCILRQYYKARELQGELQKAIKIEKAYEDAIHRIQTTESLYREVETKEREMGKIEKDVNRRNALEPKLKLYDHKQKQLREIAQEWPKKEERMKHFTDKKKELGEKIEGLAKELTQAQREQEMKRKRKIYRNSNRFKKELDEIEEEYKKFPSISMKKVQELDNKEKELSRLKAEIEGMGLKVRMATKKNIKIKVKSGLGGEEVLYTEGERCFEAQGRFNIETPEWSVDIQSGEKDVEALFQEIRGLEKYLKDELYVLGLSSIEEAKKIRKYVSDLEGRKHVLDTRFKDALEGYVYDELEKELEDAGEEKIMREPGVVKEELLKSKFEFKRLEDKTNELRSQLKAWQDVYGDNDNLLETMVELKGGSKAIEKELDELAPLPEGYKNAEGFIEGLKGLRKDKEGLQKELMICRENKIKAELNLTEESPEEIDKAFKAALVRLKNLKEEAAALRIVEEEFNRLKEKLDGYTFVPLQELFMEYLSPLTGYRYKHAQMKEALPEGIAPADGVEPLPIELLSYGTISGVALALRLAMARYLFREDEGFIVMDDPLIDLDPGRKKEAAKVLQKAAEGRQIIITTFEPDTAMLLGGNIVKI